jgi:hypothetical protein
MAGTMRRATLEVLNPVAPRVTTEVVPAPRLDTLDGKRIGLWWNRKQNGDVALAALARALGERYPRAEFVNFAFSRPTTLNHPEAYDTVVASGVEAVLAATAD